MKPRTLKIEVAGDFYTGKVFSRIRLNGHWLAKAGFPPGSRVRVEQSQPGELRLLLQSAEPAATT